LNNNAFNANGKYASKGTPILNTGKKKKNVPPSHSQNQFQTLMTDAGIETSKRAFCAKQLLFPLLSATFFIVHVAPLVLA